MRTAISRRPVVVVHEAGSPEQGHGHATLETLAARIEGLLGPHASDRAYVVPAGTLLANEAERLDIHDENDLFGGVVPHAFLATKLISHGLPPGSFEAPKGWSPALADALAGCVLPGYAAFSHRDAFAAAALLLDEGRVRYKSGNGIGGSGQGVVADLESLEHALGGVDPAGLRKHGLVLETNLEQETTYSVGEVVLAGVRIAYWGTQCQTRDHAGASVYGGSDLFVTRGTLADLSARARDDEVGRAIAQAIHYDRAVHTSFPGMFASRRNYDIALGHDAKGRRRCGVLEQSWRIGGASAAEIVAVEVFLQDPAREHVHVSTHEVYGPAGIPPGASVHYRGNDPRAGRLTKYSMVHADGHTSR